MSERIQKVLAQLGYGSRRELEQWIQAGRIKVNGRVAVLGDRISTTDKVYADGHIVKFPEVQKTRRRVLIYNKPEGEICTRDDPQARTTVFNRLPKLSHGRWIAVGRLDINTSGLLLFTNDGELANRLMHPSSKIDREYAVRILGQVDNDMLGRLREGVLLEDGLARFTDVQHYDGQGANQWYHVVIMDGRNREVRRLWESQDVKVSRLKRVRYGNIFLSSDLSVGRWKELSGKDLDNLVKMVDLEPQPHYQPTVKEQQVLQRQHRQSRSVSRNKPHRASNSRTPKKLNHHKSIKKQQKS